MKTYKRHHNHQLQEEKMFIDMNNPNANCINIVKTYHVREDETTEHCAITLSCILAADKGLAAKVTTHNGGHLVTAQSKSVLFLKK